MKQRSDGRWVKVKTVNGKRIAFYSKQKAERAAMRDIENQMMQFAERQANGAPFSEVADSWWGEAYETLAHQSAKTYKPALARAKEQFADTPIKEITARDISIYLARLGKIGYSQKTVANQKLVINLIFEHAILEGMLDHNVCKSAVMPKGLKKEERAPASVKDEQTIISSPDVWLFPFIAIYTGMRKGEILALQWKDIDFEKNIISVSKSVYHVGDRPQIKEPKTKSSIRLVPLLKPLRDHLITIAGKPDQYIVSDTGEKPLTNRRFITLSRHYKEQTGVECTAHQLRHSFATIAIENDINPKSVQGVLGHSQISTTMNIYAAFREKALAEAAEKLNEAFDRKTK